MAKWKLVIGVLLAIILLTVFWLYHHRSEAVYNRIIQEDGYELSLVREGISAEFFLKPEWIPEREGEENRLDLVISKQGDTDIVLEMVAKREKDFYIQLNLVPHPNRKAGQLLSTSIIEGGTFSTGNFQSWQLTNSKGTEMLKGQFGTGSGPGNLSNIFIDDTFRDKFANGAQVRFSGYYLYGYRQLPTYYASALLSIFYIVIVIAGLVMLYRQREEQEKGLAWKLIGYHLLGGFTFAFNAVRLPLGFAVYWLFFRKSNTNRDIKRKAAVFGLLLALLQWVTPGIVGALDLNGKSAVIHRVSIEELGHDGIWKMIAAQLRISDQAKVNRYEAVVSSGGQPQSFYLHLVDWDTQGRYIHIEANYDGSEHTVKTGHYFTDEWQQFPGTIPADYFFNKVQSLQLANLKPYGGEYKQVKLELQQYGGWVSYAIRDAHTFGVDEEGAYEIKKEQLPVQGIWMTACGLPEATHPARGCENFAHYLFDIEGGSLRDT
ncbi:hypothetical protein [Paenibacillus soyae]|uniref:Uncharacterized protein n=1 Tax=Paenibacillus soyae TaxID=2969249 RepID=A0A9X2MQ03_9BACL|nr:hypothetical protein [Paenibacillus soyae]MCR2804122.1 hypothetical protein [Paenibacillus soyae]